MKDAFPRRFIVAVPPSSSAWIGEALKRTFAFQTSLPAPMQRLIDQLDKAH